MSLPEYAYTTRAKQPQSDPAEAFMDAWVEGVTQEDVCDWLISTLGRGIDEDSGNPVLLAYKCFVLGYVAAAARVPFVPVDPASVLQRDGKLGR